MWFGRDLYKKGLLGGIFVFIGVELSEEAVVRRSISTNIWGLEREDSGVGVKERKRLNDK